MSWLDKPKRKRAPIQWFTCRVCGAEAINTSSRPSFVCSTQCLSVWQMRQRAKRAFNTSEGQQDGRVE